MLRIEKVGRETGVDYEPILEVLLSCEYSESALSHRHTRECRRDIWHGDDMAGDGELRARWNKALVEELAASCYSRVLVAAKDSLGGGDAYEALWPTGHTAAGSMWRGLADSLMALAKPLPLLKTRLRGGTWVAPTNCVVWAAGDVGGEGGGAEEDDQQQHALAQIMLEEKVLAGGAAAVTQQLFYNSLLSESFFSCMIRNFSRIGCSSERVSAREHVPLLSRGPCAHASGVHVCRSCLEMQRQRSNIRI